MKDLSVHIGDFSVIDTYGRTEMKQLGIPGLALGIVHRDQIAHL